jgi:hypothetical protein
VSFYEILVEGHPERCRGLLQGLAIGSSSAARILLGEDCGIRTPVGERLLEMVRPAAGVSHVVVDEEGRRLIREHAAGLHAAGLSVAEERAIAGGRFRYRFHAFGRRYAQEIHELLRSLPEELRHEPEESRETVDETAAGLEAYAPVHEYEIEGGGTVSGARIDLLVEARKRLDGHPLVKAETIELEPLEA